MKRPYGSKSAPLSPQMYRTLYPTLFRHNLKYYAGCALLRSRLRALLLQGPVDGLEGRPQGRGRHGALGLAAELFLLSIRVGARSAQGQVIEVERVELGLGAVLVVC